MKLTLKIDNTMDWIRIQDKMPEILEKIIFWHEKQNTVQVGVAMPSSVMVDGYDYNCSHWMPLPEPPKKEDEQEEANKN